MKDLNKYQNFDPVKKTKAEEEACKLLGQLYTGEEFTGDELDRAFCMMMLKNKQGSVGIEEVLCQKLGLDQNTHKNGFDGKHKNTNELYELKPNSARRPRAMFNDITPAKIEQMETTPNLKVVVASSNKDGELVFMVVLSGKNVAQLLKLKYYKRRESIGSNDTIGTRHTPSVSVFEYFNHFKFSGLKVVYYKKQKGFQQKLIDNLGLTCEINELDKIRDQQMASNQEMESKEVTTSHTLKSIPNGVPLGQTFFNFD